jgi:REP element-mobilizing transposase RayT
MATPRRLLVDPAESGTFHCISRCVRRAFLCGRDAHSGQNFEHRRAWIRDRLRELADGFAIEVRSYSVMSNHLHVVARTLPGRATAWNDEEVARRWLRFFPGPGGKPGRPPGEAAIRALCGDPEKLATRRARLADLSWFMRCLNEPIARRANREDDCTGRFWEGRFKCQKLDDEGAILACMTYVDLNPVRAGLAETPEASDFTSAQDRAVARRARRQLAEAPQDPTAAQEPLLAQARAEATRDSWLAPFATPCESLSETLPETRTDPSPPADPPSLLAGLSEERYLELLDWTGRQIRSGKRGQLSPHLRPMLDRLDLDVEAWVDNVAGYGGLFHRLAGKVHRLRELARSIGRASFHGHRGAHQLYAEAA